jgi:pre-rRNA-processing protein TSR4
MQTSSVPNPFGLGTQIFCDASTEAPISPAEVAETESDGESEGSASSTSDASLITAMASTSLETSPWISAPSYPPLYLSTVSEYLPPPPKAKLPAGVHIQDPADDDSGKEDGKNKNWAFEAYENSLEVDHVFDRFTKRVGYEGEQCVRYSIPVLPRLHVY